MHHIVKVHVACSAGCLVATIEIWSLAPTTYIMISKGYELTTDSLLRVFNNNLC